MWGISNTTASEDIKWYSQYPKPKRDRGVRVRFTEVKYIVVSIKFPSVRASVTYS